MTPRVRGRLVNAALVAGSVLISAAAIEGVIGYALSHPEILASADGAVSRPLALARNYYMRKDRRIVQYVPDCAVYDAEVTYTLRPGGSCVVENREHRVTYAANRLGLRDDDATLAKPAVVVLGDSHALGWGVAAEAAFPKALQRELGAAVLNVAMSSYGTAREFALLRRVDAAEARAIVIQYCENDYEENRHLAERGSLDISSEPRYRALIAEHAADTRYYPFKYLRNLFSIARLAMPWRRVPPPAPDINAEEARAFLDVLLHHATIIAGRPVVVIELNEYRRSDRRFLDEVNRLLRTDRYAHLGDLVSTVDVSALLTQADYYILDDHMRPSGHAKVAAAVATELRRRGVTRP